MPRHLTVPPGSFHHPSAVAVAVAVAVAIVVSVTVTVTVAVVAAATFAAATATPAETYDNGKNDGGDEERLSDVEPVMDLVASCFWRKYFVEPSERIAAKVFRCN
ncbi:hypothetical protein ACJIZ3_020030 [Penstemon smallii]|uniref:Uncharacterized protein n=1 Tax=Penstemon smallii TaxID=265156 RepID=A0ABD3SHF0_9LAMI